MNCNGRKQQALARSLKPDAWGPIQGAHKKTQPPRLRSHIQKPQATTQAAARELLYQQSPTRLLLTVVVMPWPAMSMVLVTVFSVGET